MIRMGRVWTYKIEETDEGCTHDCPVADHVSRDERVFRKEDLVRGERDDNEWAEYNHGNDRG